MMDFNSSSSISGQITTLVDAGMQRVRSTEVQREYQVHRVSERHANELCSTSLPRRRSIMAVTMMGACYAFSSVDM